MALLLSLSFNLSAQSSCEPPLYNFNNKSNVNGTVGVGTEFTFSNVLSNVNAIVTITKMQNATINNANMDNASPYAQAWQPFITFPSSRSAAGDSSYIEYKVRFVSNNQTSSQACMAMTIVDCDGNGSGNTYREMVKVSLPGNPMGISNSTISGYEDSRWMLFKSGPATFSNIDTVNKAAMGQVNFPAGTHTFYIRVGVVGPVSANTQRQFSFYFKSFTGLLVPLPVNLISFTSVSSGDNVQLNWISSDEHQFSHYEVFKSTNGKDYTYVASVEASGNVNSISNYTFTDSRLPGESNQVFYKLKLVDLNGLYQWSGVRSVLYNQVASTEGIVFPNPVLNDFTVLPSAGANIQRLILNDALGQELIKHSISTDSTAKFDISNLQAGIYNLYIYYEDGTCQAVKLVKQ